MSELGKFIWPLGKFRGVPLSGIPNWYINFVIREFDDGNLKDKMIEWKKIKDKKKKSHKRTQFDIKLERIKAILERENPPKPVEDPDDIPF